LSNLKLCETGKLLKNGQGSDFFFVSKLIPDKRMLKSLKTMCFRTKRVIWLFSGMPTNFVYHFPQTKGQCKLDKNNF